MSEVIKNFALLLWAACAINGGTASANAQGIQEEQNKISIPATPPTIVFGKAATSTGGSDEIILEQPDNSVNPLGNPIPEIVEPQSNLAPSATPPQQTSSNHQSTDKQPMLVKEQKALGKQFQNTLMEANGMVYDVQAYPAEDFKAIGNPSNPATIYSPNVNP